jgi:hypothetical protein
MYWITCKYHSAFLSVTLGGRLYNHQCLVTTHTGCQGWERRGLARVRAHLVLSLEPEILAAFETFRVVRFNFIQIGLWLYILETLLIIACSDMYMN